MRDISPPYQWGATQNVTISGTSAATSSATNADTRLLRLCATTDCYVAFGESPTASTSSYLLPAGVVDYVVVAGATKVAGIQASSGGVLSVTEVSR